MEVWLGFGPYFSSPLISKAQLLNVKCSKAKGGALKKELGVLSEKAFVWCWMFWNKVGHCFEGVDYFDGGGRVCFVGVLLALF